MSEKTQLELSVIVNEVTSFITRKVEADPRYRDGMSDQELMELCLAVMHEDQANPEKEWADRLSGLIVDTRRGMVPGLLAQQEAERAK